MWQHREVLYGDVVRLLVLHDSLKQNAFHEEPV